MKVRGALEDTRADAVAADRAVPLRGLVLSIASLTIPLAAATFQGDLDDPVALLPWLAALIPGFLMAYYRGWRGSAAALAMGMAAIMVWTSILAVRGSPVPSWPTQTALVVALIAFCFGLGIVTELLHRERFRASEEALNDPLTGLASRRHVEVFLEASVASADLVERDLSLVVLEIDQFTPLVGTHGAAAGDRVVRGLASILEARAEPPALCGRLRADTLVAVLPHTGEAAARRLGEDVRHRLTELDLPWQPLTVSLGVATLTRGVSNWRQLLHRAESQLHEPQEGGRAAGSSAAGSARGTGSGRGAAQPAEDAVDGPLGIVALPPAARRSIRTVLELSGLDVKELDELEDLAGVPPTGGPTLIITAIDDLAELDSLRSAADVTEGEATKWLVFVEDAEATTPLPQHQGLALLRGTPSGEALLPLIGGLLNEARAAGGGGLAPIEGGFESKLAERDARLTEGRILIVDDEKASRDVLRRTLEALGFNDVRTAQNGEDAMEAVVEAPPDLVMLDLQMPGMDGFRVLEALAPLLEGDGFLPVLVVTGDQEPKHRQRVLSTGAKDFLHKPFDVSELGARVLNLLETRKLHLQARNTNAILEQRVHQRTQELGLAKDEIIFRLARAAEYRDDLTGRHAARVAAAAAVLATCLGIDPERCELLRRAAPLHDVGKIGIPDAILLKTGKLTPEEVDIMRRHTTIGAELLAHSTSDVIEEARVIALSHHERWDGHGYPNGLTTTEIPIQGRIVALVDALDALTHERPYKPAYPFDESLRRLVTEAGSAFDPAVVAALQTAAFRVRDILLDTSGERQRSFVASH